MALMPNIGNTQGIMFNSKPPKKAVIITQTIPIIECWDVDIFCEILIGV